MAKLTFSIGFDRFVDLEWANYAYELAQENLVQDAKKKYLGDWMRSQIAGKESARKTSNVLSNLWFHSNSDLDELRYKAFKLGANKQDAFSQMIFHYGMAINVYSFFRDVCIIIGRLSNIQGVFDRNEIHQRMLEKYGNIGSVPRATNRVLQSLVNWNLLQTNSRKIELLLIKEIQPLVATWLAEALVIAHPHHRLLVSDLFHSPELLGINIEESSLENSTILFLERDGASMKFVKLGNDGYYR